MLSSIKHLLLWIAKMSLPSYTITLPHLRWCSSDCSKRIRNITRCLWTLPMINKWVTVQYDDGSRKEPPREVNKHKCLSNGNGKYASFFWVNEHVFMIVDADRPTKNYKAWTSYYEDQGVAGFFVFCNRKSTQFIFENCSIPVFPCNFPPYYQFPQDTLEEAHANLLEREKNISVFYRGKPKHNDIRVKWAKVIQDTIPNAHSINNSKGDNTGQGIKIPEYVDLMSRAKIAWIPKSCLCPPYEHENVSIARDAEAMCLEALVLRNPLSEIQRVPKLPGVHYVEYAEDCSDLIDKIRYYLEHEDERKQITTNARIYYERYGSPLGRAKLIFKDCLSVIKKSAKVTTIE